MEIFFYKMIDKTDKAIAWFSNAPLKKKLMVLFVGLVVIGIIANI
jgi:hypothetical protein